MRDSTSLSVTKQASLLHISRRDYWEILGAILAWLRNYESLAAQERRVTDTRLSEWLPPGVRVLCKRCGTNLQMVPCVECLLNGNQAGMGDDPEVKDTWHLPWKLTQDRFDERPTTARPGSPDKLEVMSRRFLQGLSVFHPDDPQMPRNHLR